MSGVQQNPMSDLEVLQMRANQVTDESLESTRRMINLCEESHGAGSRTLQMLEHQGEQLSRVENHMETMNSEMKEAERHITGMEKWCGLCICPWNRAGKIRDNDVTWSSGDKKTAITDQQPTKRNGAKMGPNAAPTGPYIQRINNDAREDEMEDNMQAVGSMLGDLKNMAKGMGEEIEKHNKQLDRITTKAETVDFRIKNANQRTEKLLK